MRKWTVDTACLMLRLAAGLIFIPHGFSKVFGSGGVATFARDLPSYGIPAALGYAAAYSELIGGVFLIIGLLTRLDALLLSCTMFVAAFVVQLPDAIRDPDAAGKNRVFFAIRAIELPLSLFALALALVFLGGGRFSLDGLVASIMAKRKAPGT